ncbi:uroporphyrinogen-III C-methyltransferase [Endozoicomonas sp. 8E]|uniref:uroporphyrinogen-III C-methyltransferase n=1 Tax=Endozoicomonas sp. 8E TaxID=3035692 RepID=UPI0029390992|nr:uroporphyrinogen-III C-methyltransferase [Endozoicomonas sp. 8E]WOG28433.1 uroporphyrinogen-III C-methyltransferase [Endozoicomonas sp. 8E]
MSKKDQNASKLEQAEPKELARSAGPSKKQESKPTSAGSRKQPQKSASKPGQKLSVLALLLAVIALGLSGSFGWQLIKWEQKQPSLIEGQEQQQTQIARLQARLAEINSDLTPIKTGLHEQESRSERLLSRTDSLTKNLQELTGSSQDGWKLAEVEYLLSLANQRLLMSSDIQSAKALLDSADKMLLELDNYNLYPVREALAEDIASLNGLPDLDQEGLYLKLEALTRQIDQLPLMEKKTLQQPLATVPKSSAMPSAGTPSASAPSTETAKWQAVALSMLKNTWESFVSLFRFTPDRDQKITSLLSPEESIIIRQNLQLMLEQAKLSVLSRDQAIYNSSLQQASNWIEKYFPLSGAQATAMLDELKALDKITVKPVTINISRALSLLKSSQLNDTPENKKNTTGQTESVQSAPTVQNSPAEKTPEMTDQTATENKTERSQPSEAPADSSEEPRK